MKNLSRGEIDGKCQLHKEISGATVCQISGKSEVTGESNTRLTINAL